MSVTLFLTFLVVLVKGAYSNLEHGYVVHESLTWNHPLRNYSLYVPDVALKRLVPLMVYLPDFWTTLEDDNDVFLAVDKFYSKTRPFALLRLEGNWAYEDIGPWSTPDFPTFWVSSPAFGDIDRYVMAVIEHVKTTKPVRGPLAIFGHGVGGWGARRIAANHASRFPVVGSLSGVTNADCLFRALLSIKKCYDDRPVGIGRLSIPEDIARKAAIALSLEKTSELGKQHRIPILADSRMPLTAAAKGTLVPNAEILEEWRKWDVHEDTRGFNGQLLYLASGTSDEFGLYACNTLFHDKLAGYKVPHEFHVTSSGVKCSTCKVTSVCSRTCEEHPEVQVCGAHRVDGPLEMESTLRDVAGKPLWTGSSISMMLDFFQKARPLLFV